MSGYSTYEILCEKCGALESIISTGLFSAHGFFAEKGWMKDHEKGTFCPDCNDSDMKQDHISE